MQTNGAGLRIINSSDDHWATDVNTAEEAVARLVTAPLNENQFSALVSFIVTIGPAVFRRSKLLRLVNQIPHEPSALHHAAREFSQWTTTDGPYEDAYLLKRRTQERRLFLKMALIKGQ